MCSERIFQAVIGKKLRQNTSSPQSLRCSTFSWGNSGTRTQLFSVIPDRGNPSGRKVAWSAVRRRIFRISYVVRNNGNSLEVQSGPLNVYFRAQIQTLSGCAVRCYRSITNSYWCPYWNTPSHLNDIAYSGWLSRCRVWLFNKFWQLKRFSNRKKDDECDTETGLVYGPTEVLPKREYIGKILRPPSFI